MPEQPDDWLSAEEVAMELRCNVSHVRGSLMGKRTGKVLIPWFKHARRDWILRKEVDAYRIKVQSGARMKSPQWQGAKPAAGKRSSTSQHGA